MTKKKLAEIIGMTVIYEKQAVRDWNSVNKRFGVKGQDARFVDSKIVYGRGKK